MVKFKPIPTLLAFKISICLQIVGVHLYRRLFCAVRKFSNLGRGEITVLFIFTTLLDTCSLLIKATENVLNQDLIAKGKSVYLNLAFRPVAENLSRDMHR